MVCALSRQSRTYRREAWEEAVKTEAGPRGLMAASRLGAASHDRGAGGELHLSPVHHQAGQPTALGGGHECTALFPHLIP
jgi:hypothetical protein